MIENISCFEILEELYKEGTDFKKELKQIVYDIGCLKTYIRYWRSYSFFKHVKDSFLPRNSKRTNTTEFIEDYENNYILMERKPMSVKGTTKFKIFSNCDREVLITKLTQTRNYYTHGDSKDKYPEMITDIHEMYETKLLLQEVLRYYIYQELDMKYKYENF